jgi:hypothetical protein
MLWVLLLLPVLVLLGACTQTIPSAIATDDRPASPQPAIASPVPVPLTIESLAGIYKATLNEKQLAELLDGAKPLHRETWDEETLKRLEMSLQQTYEQYQIKIYANSTFEFLPYQLHGQAKLDGNKLILTADPARPVLEANGTSLLSKPFITTVNVSADGKKLLIYDLNSPSKSPGVYVKQ